MLLCSKFIFTRKRTEKADLIIKEINRKRKLVGLSTTEEEIHKSIFYLNNKDYVFSNNVISGYNFKNDSDVEIIKKNLIKLDDTTH